MPIQPLFSPNDFFDQELRQMISPAITAAELIIHSTEVMRLILFLKILGMILTTLLMIAILILIIRMNIFSLKIKSAKSFLFLVSDFEKGKIARQWNTIKDRLRKGQDAELRLAVIEADQLLDSVLKRLGISGSSMAERLEKIRPWQLPNLPDVWIAHKMRNRLVHEPQTKITAYEATAAVQIYEKALKFLGFLD